MFTNKYTSYMAYLEVKDVTYKVDGKRILENVSFNLEKGTITLLAGRNGSGKSALLRILKGLEKEDEGEVILEGTPLKRRADRLKRLALIFQDADLEIVGSTVEKDIRFGLENQRRPKEEIERKTRDALREFGLESLGTSSPRVLSGGEKRKVAIASVVAMEQELILMDEILANLDYPSTRLILRTLVDLKKKGATILLVSHEAEKLLALTDHTIILSEGHVVFDGCSQEALEALRENDIYLPPLGYEELSWL